MIFDAHLHAFSFSFFKALEEEARQFSSASPSLESVAQKISLKLPQENPIEHAKQWRTEFEKNQVSASVCFASHPKEAESVAEMVKFFPQIFFPLCVINPKMPNAQTRIAQITESFGFRGFVLFPSLHHYFLKEQTEFLEYANKHQLTLVVHCGILNIPLRHHLGLPKTYQMQYANPLDLIPVANQYPQLKIQIPHFGAGFLRECMMLGYSCPNVYVDTSSSNSWVSTNGIPLEQVFTQALNCFGSERILFGTDSSTFPRGWNRQVYEIQKNILERLKISEEEKHSIFYENTFRLYSKPQSN